MNRHLDWLRQAENDLEWAEHSFQGGFFAQTCFIAQQASEKALKAYCFFKGFDIVRTHSLYQIIKSLGENGILEKHARELDLFYISARYPDAFPAGAPFEIITTEQAQRAIEAATEIFKILRERLPDENP
ncbi:HEPN domain-containing protein [Trichloromonas acetexigens]|uniref:HEPN domain-containing protein n=1 Tax=Trichloromonas acetexigens TaxID=38815 RepID=A0A550JJL6_9BACT|nr:HEPN domain-containing protein [Desulfuromonas acetexigens]TRO83378.1 HEPN domain-containing protein [Desulfuromonas acetexigens]